MLQHRLLIAAQLLRCIDDNVNRWMCSNGLKITADKMQFIWLNAPRWLQQVISVQLIVNGVVVSDGSFQMMLCAPWYMCMSQFALTTVTFARQHTCT